MSARTNRIIEKANRCIQQRKLEKALTLYDRALEADPEEVGILHKKGDLLVKMERLAQAVETYLTLAGIYSRLGFPVKAVAVMKQAIKTDAAPIEIHLQLAEEYRKLRMRREEIECLEITLAAHEKAGRWAEMRELLERLIELEPTSIAPILRICDLLLLQGQRASAVDLLAATAARLSEEERIHEQGEVAERLAALDPDFAAEESGWEERFQALLDKVSATPSTQWKEGGDELAIEIEVTEPELLATGEELISKDDPIAGMDRKSREREPERQAAPRSDRPAPEVAFSEDELEECLQDIDFYALEKLFDDAWDLLNALKARLPNNRRVLSCMAVLGQLRKRSNRWMAPLSAESLSPCLH